MELRFKCVSEYVRLVIDRKKRILKISSSRTKNELIEVPWKMLFDKGKEKVQDSLTKTLNDDSFKKIIVASMIQKGY